MIKTMIFTHRPCVSPALLSFSWWHHNRLLMMSQWPDNSDAIAWTVISDLLDIDFIHGDIHSRSCKNTWYPLKYFLLQCTNMYQSWYQYCCWCWIIYDAFLIASSAVSNDTFFKLMTFLFQVSLSYWIMKMVQWSIIVNSSCTGDAYIQYIPRNMHTVFALLCFVVVIHWLIFPYPSG